MNVSAVKEQASCFRSDLSPQNTSKRLHDRVDLFFTLPANLFDFLLLVFDGITICIDSTLLCTRTCSVLLTSLLRTKIALMVSVESVIQASAIFTSSDQLSCYFNG